MRYSYIVKVDLEGTPEDYVPSDLAVFVLGLPDLLQHNPPEVVEELPKLLRLRTQGSAELLHPIFNMDHLVVVRLAAVQLEQAGFQVRQLQQFGNQCEFITFSYGIFL